MTDAGGPTEEIDLRRGELALEADGTPLLSARDRHARGQGAPADH